MKDVTQDASNPGKTLATSPSYQSGSKDVSVVNYISGIEQFDNILKGAKWAETNFDLYIFAYKDFIHFAVLLNRHKHTGFTLPKSAITDISVRHDQQIEISTKSNLSGSLSLLSAAGILGNVVAGTIESLADRGDKTKSKSKLVKGSIYELSVQNEDGTIEKIILSCEWKYFFHLNGFFDFMYKFNLKSQTPKSKGCYIATACYGDSNAKQVVRFKKFRDEVLLKHFWGKLFVSFYYLVSPPLSQWLIKKPKVNKFIKSNILDRIYNKIK